MFLFFPGSVNIENSSDYISLSIKGSIDKFKYFSVGDGSSH